MWTYQFIRSKGKNRQRYHRRCVNIMDLPATRSMKLGLFAWVTKIQNQDHERQCLHWLLYLAESDRWTYFWTELINNGRSRKMPLSFSALSQQVYYRLDTWTQVQFLRGQRTNKKVTTRITAENIWHLTKPQKTNSKAIGHSCCTSLDMGTQKQDQQPDEKGNRKGWN